jgi:outer membrane protein assembly factor BamD (BamD/ComL family)
VGAVETRSFVEPASSVPRWQEFVEQFGDTVYAPFMRLTLASLYRADGILPTVRPDLAAEQLRAIVTTGPRFIADDALFELAKAELDEGRTDEARAAAKELLRTYPNSEHARDARRILDGLKAGRRTLQEIYAH